MEEYQRFADIYNKLAQDMENKDLNPSRLLELLIAYDETKKE